MLASIGTNKTAKKAALIHLLFNLFGTLIFIPFIKPLTSFVGNISPEDIPRQIANEHIIFNILNTIIMAPFIKYLVMLVNKLIPGEDEYEKMAPKYIDDRLLETPVIAVGQTIKEVIRMANKAEENVEISMNAFVNNAEGLIAKVYENEKLINVLEKDITAYLVHLSNTELSEEQLQIVTSMFHVVNDIERIGDHAENLADLTCEKINKNLNFSEDVINQLKDMYNLAIEALKKSIVAFENNDFEKAQEVMCIEDKIDDLEEDLRENNTKRLHVHVRQIAV